MSSSSLAFATECAGPLEAKDIAPVTGVNKYALDFLDDVSYKLMTTENDLDQVFRMRHDAYKAAKHISGNEDGLWTDPADTCPTASLIGVYVAGNLAASVRLHRLANLDAQSTAVVVFPNEMKEKFNQGFTCSDTNRLSCDVQFLKKFKALPLATIRVTGLHAFHFGCSYSLAAVRDQHEPFYKRILGARRWNEGEGVHFKGTTMILHLLASSMDEMRVRCYRDRQYFLSTQEERTALFEGKSGEHVIPSAKKVIDGADSGFWDVHLQ